MKHGKAIAALVLLMLGSCVSPGRIDILQPINWTVFGLMGEGKAPVIFVYSLNSDDPSYIYYEDAEIVITHENSGLSTVLVPVSNLDNPAFAASQEFPFDVDTSGLLIYYTTDLAAPLPAGNYRVDLEIEGETGTAYLDFPEARNFTSVELQTGGNGVSKVVMELPGADEPGYYKWEILIDQNLDLLTPVAFDSITGEPTEFQPLLFPFYQEITPGRYITPEKIEADGTTFRYNLSESLPDYPYSEETYYLNVRLRHYSQDLVDFFESITDQQSGTLFDPFIEPNVIDTNIEGLFGVIGTYSYSQSTQLEYTP